MLAVNPTLALRLYVFDGAIDADVPFGPRGIAFFDAKGRPYADGDERRCRPVRWGAGRRPLLFSGSFVMDTQERLTQAKRDFSEGRMGTLDGVPF